MQVPQLKAEEVKNLIVATEFEVIVKAKSKENKTYIEYFFAKNQLVKKIYHVINNKKTLAVTCCSDYFDSRLFFNEKDVKFKFLNQKLKEFFNSFGNLEIKYNQ